MKEWGKQRSDADLEEELRVHLEMQAEDNIGAGISMEEARRRARLRLGRAREIIERVRDQDLATALESWYRDIVLGIRAIRKRPVFCVTAILTLALGMGANSAIFAVLYGLLLRGLPVANPERLAHIGVVSAASQFNYVSSLIPYGMLEQLRREQHSFTDISAWYRAGLPMVDGEGTLRIFGAGAVSGNAFSLLGVKPRLGRLIGEGDDVRGGPAEGWPVVLSYGFWKERFPEDWRVIGKQIEIANIPVTIVGVAPADFRGVWPGDDIKLYLPFQFLTRVMEKDKINSANSVFPCAAISRLKPGVTMGEAKREVAFRQTALFREFIPAKYLVNPFWQKASLRVESARGGLPTYFSHVYKEPLYLMQGLVAMVLALCCVNVGGLMMSAVYARQREFAVRTAIGAARWRLVRQHLAESFTIALAGTALGAVAAWYGSPALLHFFRNPMMGEPISVEPDSAVFWVAGWCAIATTLACGLLPAWRAGRSDPGVLLTSRSVSGGRRRIAGRAFVPIQVGLSLVLVALATLLSQSLARIRTERTGFELDHVTIQTAPFDHLREKGTARMDLYQKMVDRLEQMPGMRAAAVTVFTPMTGFQASSQFEGSGQEAGPPKNAQMAYNEVGPGYFRAMETHIVEGREFEKNERMRNVCVLNKSAARRLFPGAQAMGGAVRSKDVKDFPEPVSCRVIGIAEDAKFANLREAPPPTIYFPLTVETVEHTNLVFLMNSATRTEAVAGYRKAISEIAPAVPLVVFVTLKDQMDAALGSERLITALSNVFGGLALLLSAIGLYGLLASSVAQRTVEIGVRMALGARRSGVVWMILREALGLVGVGVVLGGVTLVFGVRLIRNMLFGVSAFDPLSLGGALGLLTVVSLAAAIPPAVRAASVDPIEALRAE